MNDSDVLDPEKSDLVNQWLAQNMAQRPGGAPIAGPSPAPEGGSPPPPTAMAQAGESAAMSGSRDPDGKIADSHPGLKTDELTPYLKGQEKQVDTFGPAQQAALMTHLQQAYKSPGNILAKGGATLADAIMQGVARAGSSGNLAAINERENQNLNRAAEMGKSLQAQNLEGLKAKQGLEELSPKTPLGGANEPAIQAVASMYKMEPAQVQALMKSNPQVALKLLDQVGQFASGQLKANIEEQMKLLEIQVQQANAQAMQGIARQGKEIEAQKTKQEAAKAILGGSSIPFVGPSHAQKQAAATELAGNADLGAQRSPQIVNSKAEYDALAPGTPYIDSKGQKAVKK